MERFFDLSKTRIALFRSGKKWILAHTPTAVFSQNSRGENFWNGEKIDGDPIDFLEGKMAKNFAVGFFGYDFCNKNPSEKNSDIPRAELVFFAEKTEAETLDFSSVARDFSIGQWQSEFPKSAWEAGFDTLKRNIFAGEIYQANLTRLFSTEFSGNSRALFAALNAQFDAPHAAFFAGENFEILSMSPEMFLDFQGKRMRTAPIKGTIRRGESAEEDARNAEELLSSEKERAELLMITDLLRNDLSQSAIAGSVQVNKMRALQQNPNVFHTFSEISAQRRDEISPLRALLAMLPGGSISGCPKIRATEILRSIEPHKREIFCGVFGFFDGNKHNESSILIRTFLRKGKKLFFQAGGGITADSERDREAEEIDAKARVFFEMTGGKVED